MEKDGFSVSDELKSKYDAYYTGAEAPWRKLNALDTVRHLVSLCQDIPHKAILDIGCGDGAVLERLSELAFGEQLHGIEISQSAVEQVKKRRIKHLVDCSLFDGYTVPYEDNRFDLAVLAHVVEHLEHPRRLLYEAGRVARRVFVEVPLEDNVFLKRDHVRDALGHINFYSPKTIRLLLQASGFDVLAMAVRNPAPAIYRHIHGAKGLLIYSAKEAALRIMPGVATRLATYRCALLCRRSG